MQLDRAVTAFLDLKRVAVVGVSRSGNSPANAIARRLRETDHTVFAVNRSGEAVDDLPTFPSLMAIDGGVDGVVVVTKPMEATQVARDAAQAGVPWIWFHQGFGPVSFDDETIRVANEGGLKVIAAACPMMFLRPDVFHRCARTVFGWTGRIPRQVAIPA